MEYKNLWGFILHLKRVMLLSKSSIKMYPLINLLRLNKKEIALL